MDRIGVDEVLAAARQVISDQADRDVRHVGNAGAISDEADRDEVAP
jgi:hypothetical protein